ncbi:hypothetical protein TWF191_003922 [Orbilia oligospora]|uniref:Uncharacterized protein n=1 Tax=Orbilia oligospora TaxID=2813651 RepID=A0A7C8R1C6_ORBOL|nr:hypothetical protein TWF191_003922 [Orbilia oligospora]
MFETKYRSISSGSFTNDLLDRCVGVTHTYSKLKDLSGEGLFGLFRKIHPRLRVFRETYHQNQNEALEIISECPVCIETFKIGEKVYAMPRTNRERLCEAPSLRSLHACKLWTGSLVWVQIVSRLLPTELYRLLDANKFQNQVSISYYHGGASHLGQLNSNVRELVLFDIKVEQEYQNRLNSAEITNLQPDMEELYGRPNETWENENQGERREDWRSDDADLEAPEGIQSACVEGMPGAFCIF